MKVTIRSSGGDMFVYIPRKDMEARVASKDSEHVFGGVIELEGGMKISIPPMDKVPKLPVTLNARKVP